jgi:CubicO group peptidase (beta-lactamase class C family)
MDLDKPVINYIPSFKLWDEYVTMNITPRDLMCHRSGLPGHDLVWYGTDFSRKEIIENLRYLEPSMPFRTTFQYQNMMFATAGYLLEQITGGAWEEFVKRRIFTPLEMTNSDFSVIDMQKTEDYSKPYNEIDGHAQEIPFMNVDAIAPAGGINSNVKEMANWVIMQLSNGKFKNNQIVSPSSMSEMHTPQMVAPGDISKEFFFVSYGLGWGISSYRGHFVLQHAGNINGFSANVALYPMDSLGIVVLSNMQLTKYNSVIRDNIADRFLSLPEIDWNSRRLELKKKEDELLKTMSQKTDPDRKPESEPPHPLKDYTGTYVHPAYGKIFITLSNGKLELKYHTLKVVLSHYNGDIFEANISELENQKFNFHTNSKGEIDKVTSLLEPAVKEIEFIRIPDYK